MKWIEKNYNDYFMCGGCKILKFICLCFGIQCLIACNCDGNGICNEKG